MPLCTYNHSLWISLNTFAMILCTTTLCILGERDISMSLYIYNPCFYTLTTIISLTHTATFPCTHITPMLLYKYSLIVLIHIWSLCYCTKFVPVSLKQTTITIYSNNSLSFNPKLIELEIILSLKFVFPQQMNKETKVLYFKLIFIVLLYNINCLLNMALEIA